MPRSVRCWASARATARASRATHATEIRAVTLSEARGRLCPSCGVASTYGLDSLESRLSVGLFLRKLSVEVHQIPRKQAMEHLDVVEKHGLGAGRDQVGMAGDRHLGL